MDRAEVVTGTRLVGQGGSRKGNGEQRLGRAKGELLLATAFWRFWRTLGSGRLKLGLSPSYLFRDDEDDNTCFALAGHRSALRARRTGTRTIHLCPSATPADRDFAAQRSVKGARTARKGFIGGTTSSWKRMQLSADDADVRRLSQDRRAADGSRVNFRPTAKCSS